MLQFYQPFVSPFEGGQGDVYSILKHPLAPLEGGCVQDIL